MLFLLLYLVYTNPLPLMNYLKKINVSMRECMSVIPTDLTAAGVEILLLFQ